MYNGWNGTTVESRDTTVNRINSAPKWVPVKIYIAKSIQSSQKFPYIPIPYVLPVKQDSGCFLLLHRLCLAEVKVQLKVGFLLLGFLGNTLINYKELRTRSFLMLLMETWRTRLRTVFSNQFYFKDFLTHPIRKNLELKQHLAFYCLTFKSATIFSLATYLF